MLIKVLKKAGSAKQASVIGNSAKLSVEQAAMVNGALSHIWEIDETHHETDYELYGELAEDGDGGGNGYFAGDDLYLHCDSYTYSI